ncbi:MAG: arsenate reductase ArsC [Clostridiales bacterium]|nr:arsenate reductase ArsC [Clostridiales bacterium]
MNKVKVAFLSNGNCCRSQMAEGLARKLGSDIMIPSSAGNQPDDNIRPEAIKAMKDIGIDISMQKTKSIDDIEKPDLIISMDVDNPCKIQGVTCIDWSLADPEGRDESFYARVRDIIASRMRVLVDDLKEGSVL